MSHHFTLVKRLNFFLFLAAKAFSQLPFQTFLFNGKKLQLFFFFFFLHRREEKYILLLLGMLDPLLKAPRGALTPTVGTPLYVARSNCGIVVK